LNAVAIVNPDTVIRWHRRGFKAFWRCRLRVQRRPADNPQGDPPSDPGDESANWLWGAPRIHGELLNARRRKF
jgi:hypothetical protein